MQIGVGLPLGIGCAALLAVTVLADDPDVAQFLYRKAEKARRARKYEEAEKSYRRALEEQSPFPEAAFGLGQALEKRGRLGEALHAYRRCRDEIAASPAPSSKWKSLASRATRAVKRVQKQFTELERLDREFIHACMSLGIRYHKTNPDAARRAYAAVLKIDPDHKQARTLLESLGKEAPSGKASKPRGRKLINGKLKGWVPGLNEYWSVSNGLLTGKAEGRTGHINWFEGERTKGRYTVRADLRILSGGPKRTCGIFLGNKHGEDRWWALMIDWNDEIALVETTARGNTSVQEKILRGFKVGSWHTVEIEVQPGALTVKFDDKRMFSHETGDRTSFDGELGMFAQDVHVLFRNLELRK